MPRRLYHEGALAAMVSGRQGLAVDLAKAAVDRLDPDTDLERWALANERLARASWIQGGMDEGLTRLQATAARLEQAPPTPILARILAALAGTLMLRGEHDRAQSTSRRRRSTCHVRSARANPRRMHSTRSARARS